MRNLSRILLLTVMASSFILSSAQGGVTLRGIYQTSRDDAYPNGYYSEYVGWNYALQKVIFLVQQGIYRLDWDGQTLSMPVKDPEVNKDDFYSNGQFTDNDKALWASNFNMMYANSGAIVKDGRWDARTYDLQSAGDDYRPAWDCLESAGMAVNPKDGKVYGLFHITNKYLPDSILNDPDFFADESADSTDSGYAICTIDLDKMEISQITPGLYYENYVTFAINSEGRAFAMSSGGGTIANPDEDGKVRDIDGNLSGAHLYEFDLNTGLMIRDHRSSTGYCSQVKRQAACFSKNDPNKMYWMGYFNSGMGFDDNGQWNPLSDRNWIENRKYDTALYEVDVTTGEANRIGVIKDRYMFAYMWVDGEQEPEIAGGLRGDVNDDGIINIDDVTTLIDYLLAGGAINMINADCDNTGSVTVGDVTSLIDYLLVGNW